MMHSEATLGHIFPASCILPPPKNPPKNRTREHLQLISQGPVMVVFLCSRGKKKPMTRTQPAACPTGPSKDPGLTPGATLRVRVRCHHMRVQGRVLGNTSPNTMKHNPGGSSCKNAPHSLRSPLKAPPPFMEWV